jgi:hypothetical protein
LPSEKDTPSEKKTEFLPKVVNAMKLLKLDADAGASEIVWGIVVCVCCDLWVLEVLEWLRKYMILLLFRVIGVA